MTATTQTTRVKTDRHQSVEDMLREIAYVLHVTRKVRTEIEWPVATPANHKKTHADRTAQATAAV